MTLGTAPKPKPTITAVRCKGAGYTTSIYYPAPASTTPGTAAAAVAVSPVVSEEWPANTGTTSPSVLATRTSGGGRVQITSALVFILAGMAAFWL
jgi:hypothetical protein